METIEIRNRFTESMLNINLCLFEPLSARQGRAFDVLDDIPILITMMCIPYVTAEMVSSFYANESNEKIINRLNKRLAGLCQKSSGEKYKFSEKTYSAPVKIEDTKYRLQNVYSLTNDGARLLYDLCNLAIEKNDVMHDILEPLIEIDEEDVFRLHVYNNNAPLTNHSISEYHCRMMIYSVSTAAVQRSIRKLSTFSLDTFVRDIKTERAIEPGFVRIPAIQKNDLSCTRIPDITMTYFCGIEGSPVCVEIDQATERGAEIYSKVKDEIQYLTDNPGEGTFGAPMVLIAQYEGESQKDTRLKIENSEYERYKELLGKSGIAASLLTYLAAYDTYHCDMSVDLSVEEFIDRTGSCVTGTMIEKYPEELKFILSFYEKIAGQEMDIKSFQEEVRNIRLAERESSKEEKNRANRLYAKRQIASLRTRDDDNGMHPLWIGAYEGCCMAACGRREVKNAIRTLMPFEFSMENCLRVIKALLNSDGKTFSLGRVLPSGSIYRVENEPGLSMRNIALLKASDGSMGRRFCFEDVSSDLGALYRLEEYVGHTPAGIAPDMMVIFLIDDDETLADGRKLSNFPYWEGSPRRHARDNYRERFIEAYGENSVSVSIENGVRNDFVFMKKSDFFADKGEPCKFFIRFGSWEIERTFDNKLPQTTKMSYLKNYRYAFTNLSLPGLTP